MMGHTELFSRFQSDSDDVVPKSDYGKWSRLMNLFIFECDFQGCAKACDELSHVILPVYFLGKISALAPTGTEIV